LESYGWLPERVNPPPNLIIHEAKENPARTPVPGPYANFEMTIASQGKGIVQLGENGYPELCPNTTGDDLQ
jgi:hypothetical protein